MRFAAPPTESIPVDDQRLALRYRPIDPSTNPFVAALRQALDAGAEGPAPSGGAQRLDDESLDLLLVALLELAPRDPEVRAIVAWGLSPFDNDNDNGDAGGDAAVTAAYALGARLLARARLTDTPTTTMTTPEGATR